MSPWLWYLAVDNFLYCSNGNSGADSVSVQAQLSPMVMGCPEDRKSLSQAGTQLSGTWLWWESADSITCGSLSAPGETERLCLVGSLLRGQGAEVFEGINPQHIISHAKLVESRISTWSYPWRCLDYMWWRAEQKKHLKLGTHTSRDHLNQVWNINTNLNNQQDVNCLSAGDTVVGDT